MSLTLWYDGERVDQHARPDLLENALHYGSGVFEGIRAYATDTGPAIFRLDAHLERMARGAERLGFTLDEEALADAMADLLLCNGLQDAYLRPIAWLGGGGLHLDADRLTVRHAAAALPWSSHLGDGDGLRVMTSSFQKASRHAIPALKLCGGYVTAMMARLEARRAGFDEALHFDGDLVVEATTTNLLAVFGGRIVAVDHPDALPGITRDTVMELSGAESRSLTRAELYDADEVMLCGTSAEVAPVIALDERRWPIGPVARELSAAYSDVVHGRDRSRESWLTRLDPALAAQ